jgi:hypothetical protein
LPEKSGRRTDAAPPEKLREVQSLTTPAEMTCATRGKRSRASIEDEANTYSGFSVFKTSVTKLV